jgi:hypothetical protein
MPLLSLLANAGHMIPRDNLAGFLDAIREFLSARPA